MKPTDRESEPTEYGNSDWPTDERADERADEQANAQADEQADGQLNTCVLPQFTIVSSPEPASACAPPPSSPLVHFGGVCLPLYVRCVGGG